MSEQPTAIRPDAAGSVPDAPVDVSAANLQRFRDDIEQVTRLSARWKGRDPMWIEESLVELLLARLNLDFIGVRLDGAAHLYFLLGEAFTREPGSDSLSDAIDPWLQCEPEDWPTSVSVGGVELHVLALPLGATASMGLLVAGCCKAEFPQETDKLTLTVAATHAGLALREVRELGQRLPPVDVRPEKLTGEALAESEWKLNLMINTIPAMAWSATPDGMLDFGNQHFLEFIGAPFEEIGGLNFYRIFHPDDMPHLLSAWQEIMASKRAREVEGRIRRADGEYRWCTLRQKPLLDPDGNVIKWYGVVLDIEDRKRAENALKETKSALLASEENLSLIINSLPVLVWSARSDGSADFVNQSWLDYAGLPADQLMGWGFLDLYHPDDIPGMVEIWKRDLEHADHTILKGRIRRADGEYRWFYFSGRKLTDANGMIRWFGVNVDIEDLQRAENALRESEAALRESEHRLSLIINTIPAMAWSASPDGMLEFWNKNLVDFVGLPFEQIVGLGFYRMFHPDDVEAMRSAWAEILTTKRGREVDARIRRADGEYRWFTLQQNPLLNDQGEVLKWYGVVFDIEDRRRTEEELRQSQTALAHATRMMTTGELAVSIAHEINQPLMAIVTNASTCLRWLEDGHFDLDQARQAAKRVIKDGHRAGEIIASIRALAQKSPARMVQMDLTRALREVFELLRGELQHRGVETNFDIPQQPMTVWGDRTQLQQVLLNLVMNGAEAMADVTSSQKQLNIRCFVNEGGFAEVSVSDTGTGLEAGSLDQIFDAFFTTKPDGMGMGLSICRSIIEAHRGHIRASSNIPDGSVFNFTVPRTEEPGVDGRS